jgi:putative membrane protein insertion efficiency factor
MSRSGTGEGAGARCSWALVGARVVAMLLKAPVHTYRWTLKPFLGWNCRHLPTCSEYALEAIDRNGAWRGFWLMTSRLCRCHHWGSAGFDPVPDIREERHALAPWRYGRWTGRHMTQHWEAPASEVGRQSR